MSYKPRTHKNIPAIAGPATSHRQTDAVKTKK